MKIYRVVRRVDGGDWEPVDTQKRLYFQPGTAKSVVGYKRKEHEYQEDHRKYLVSRTGADLPSRTVEFKAQQAEVGDWEDVDAVR